MKRVLRWYDYITLNIYWLGINLSSGIITPLLLPYLVALFVPAEVKNTSLANVRVVGLAVAMMAQPVAGMLSDRSDLRWGKRRPYIFTGAVLSIMFLFIIGASPNFPHRTAYLVLMAGIVLLQVSSNIGHGALQGLIPDMVAEDQRGGASGAKAVFELLPVILIVVLGVGGWVDDGKVWLTVGLIMVGFLATMLVTIFFIQETPLKEKPAGSLREPILRVVLLTVIFVGVTQTATWLVKASAAWLNNQEVSLAVQVIVVGLAGLLGMAGSIFLGVYFGARVGIGREAGQQSSFIWWVVNRILFLAAVGSIQGFARFFLEDVIKVDDPGMMTTILLGVVAVFLLITAIIGGYLADRIGRKRLVGLAGIVAAVGTLLLLFSQSVAMVLVAGCIIGAGAGTFMATNWALGTDLVPPEQAGRYLGISNLAGAGAGIVGAGIGGPMADFFNGLQPGLGYLVIIGIYAGLFLLSTLTLTRVKVISD